MSKTFIKVLAEHDVTGKIKPISLTWTDGRVFEIDRVKNAIFAPALKGGGVGMRYTCKIRGKEVFLFCDDGKWFIEG